MMNYKLKTLKDDATLGNKHWEIVKSIWVPLMLHSTVAQKYWARLEKYFPDFQIFLIDKGSQVIGFSNTVPFSWNKKLNLLPDTGWDWLMEKGITDFERGIKANHLGGLQVGISQDYQGKGYSKVLIEEARQLCRLKQLNSFVIPIRPTLKYKYPLIPMKEYIKWRTGNKIFDPWIRTHINCGAKIIKICKKSMTFTGSIKEWEEWGGINILDSGKYIIDGVLQPVSIDFKKNKGTYYDENIWIYYDENQGK
jgi:GNAT superfamily N-acetyltransferase